MAEERTSENVIYKILEDKDDSVLRTCAIEPDMKGKTAQEMRLHMISKIETQSPAEEDILKQTQTHYR